MGVLFQILLVVSVFGVAAAGFEVWRRRKEVWRRRKEVRRLREEHGDAYDEVRKRWKR